MLNNMKNFFHSNEIRFKIFGIYLQKIEEICIINVNNILDTRCASITDMINFDPLF